MRQIGASFRCKLGTHFFPKVERLVEARFLLQHWSHFLLQSSTPTVSSWGSPAAAAGDPGRDDHNPRASCPCGRQGARKQCSFALRVHALKVASRQIKSRRGRAGRPHLRRSRHATGNVAVHAHQPDTSRCRIPGDGTRKAMVGPPLGVAFPTDGHATLGRLLWICAASERDVANDCLVFLPRGWGQVRIRHPIAKVTARVG